MSRDTPSLPGTRSAGESTATIWTGRIISTLLTLMLALDGVMKLIQPEEVVIQSRRVGVPDTALAGIGIALLASVVLYAIPPTTVLGAILLTGYLGGAVFAHVHIGDPAWMIVMPMIFGGLVWLGPFLRDARLRALIPIRQ
jgi:DoxX-like family